MVGESGAVVAIQADATGGVIGDGEGVLRGREGNDFARADGHRNHLVLTQAGDLRLRGAEDRCGEDWVFVELMVS